MNYCEIMLFKCESVAKGKVRLIPSYMALYLAIHLCTVGPKIEFFFEKWQ